MSDKKMKHYNGLVSALTNDLLEKISVDYNLDLETLKEKYLEPKIKAPKRQKNISGYNLFCGDMEIDKQLRLENPHMIFSEISKKKGKLWSSLPKTEKDKWLDYAKKQNEIPKKISHEHFNIV